MPDAISPSFVDRVRAAPKAELHVHLVGAMPPAFFAEQILRYSREEAFSDASPRHLEFFGRFEHLASLLPGAAAGARGGDLLGFSSFDGFLASYFLSTFYLRDLDDLRRLAAAVRERLQADNIVYAELTISPAEHLPRAKITLEGLCELMDEVAAGGEPRIVWIVDLVRNTGAQAAGDLLERMLEMRPSSWVGITLGGAEHLFPPAPFEKVYRRARDAGLRLSVHAGEALGPESVWDAVRVLGAERIGHGVRSIEDPRLVEYLAEHQIPLEVCPSGNVKTGIYESLSRHPLKQLHAAGIPLTLNTDDPAFFGVSLSDELVAARGAGLSEAAVDDLRRNAFEQAFSFEGRIPE